MKTPFPAALALGCLLAPGALEAQPRIAFEEGAVVARGLGPGAPAALFSIARVPRGYYAQAVRRDEILTADPTGEVRLEVPEGIPLQSIWAVVDLASGAFELAGPEGYELREVGFPGNGLQRGFGGQLNRLVNAWGFVEVFYARPGGGAWSLTAGDGGAGDEDGRPDGAVAASLSGMQPIGDSPAPPEHFLPGDILIAVEPREMVFYAARLAPAAGGN